MMSIHVALDNLGLTKNEVEVYLGLLELGKASMTEIAKKSQLKRPTVYLIIEKLKSKGLASETQVKKRKEYSPKHPKSLLEMARANEQQIEAALPELTALYNSPSSKPKIQVFEGIKGMHLIYKDIFSTLRRGNELLFFANVEPLYNEIPEIIKMFKKELSQLEVIRARELQCHNEGAKKWLKDFRDDLKRGYEIRWLPEHLKFGSCDTAIFENKVVIFSCVKEWFVTVIENEEVAKTHRTLFEMAWNMGKKPN